MKGYTYEYFKKSADYILSKIDFKPQVALILGSCLGPLADEIEDAVVIDYKDIPNFLVSTAHSHASQLVLGTLGGKKVVAMSGRFHYYEGYDFEELTAPIRVFQLLGVKTTILTNAAGAVNLDYEPGDIMVISDHVKLMGASPLRGPNVEEFGPRFFDVTQMYTPRLRALAHEAAKQTNQQARLREGVYYYWTGPQFETPAEVRAIRILGGDAVGMSTVTEALTAAHCGMQLLGLSLMVNMAAGVCEGGIDEDEVDATADEAAGRFKILMRKIVELLD